MLETFENIIDILSKYWFEFLVRGVSVTIILSAVTVLCGTIIGTGIAFGKMSRFKLLRIILTAFIEVIRGTPILLQLYIGVFVVPKIFTGMATIENIDLISVTITLIINSSAYVSEIIRAGIQAVDKGQSEAARSLGLNSSQTMLRVVIPQAVKNILPALGNEFVMMLKETSLASTFFIGDLMTSYQKVKGITYQSLECLIIVGIIYFILTFPISKIIGHYEKKLKVSD